MTVFLYTYCWHYQVYSLDSDGNIWRMWIGNDDQSLIEKLISNEIKHLGPINILKSMEKAR